MRLRELAELLGGEFYGQDGEVLGVSSPENPKEMTLIFLKDEKKLKKLKGNYYFVSERKLEGVKGGIVVKDLKLSLAKALEILYPEEHPSGLSKNCVIKEGVSIGKDVYVGDFCYIGKGCILEDGVKVYPFTYIGDFCTIGEGTIIFPSVVLYPRTVVGKGVRIHSGVVLGADGFGYHITKEGIYKLRHVGNVVVEDFVEIGANTTVDRALIDSTTIGKETKIDNLVMISHNCKIGRRNLLVAQVGIAGSTKTGKDVILGGQVGVSDHLKIGDGVRVAAKSGVTKNLKPNKTYGALIPAMEWSKWKKLYARLLRLIPL